MKDGTMKAETFTNNGGEAVPLPKCTYNDPVAMGDPKQYKRSSVPTIHESKMPKPKTFAKPSVPK